MLFPIDGNPNDPSRLAFQMSETGKKGQLRAVGCADQSGSADTAFVWRGTGRICGHAHDQSAPIFGGLFWNGPRRGLIHHH